MGNALLLTILALLVIGGLEELRKYLRRKSRAQPVMVRLDVVQAGEMLILDARAIPRELVFNQELFRHSARQLRVLPSLLTHIWIFSEGVLREIAKTPALLSHLNDGRRSPGLNYLYAKKGLLTDAEEARLKPHAEVTWSVDLISPQGRMDLEQLLTAARAQTVS